MIEASGALKPVTTVSDGERRHALPSPLPGGRALLFTARKNAILWGDEEVVALTLATGQRKRLLTGSVSTVITGAGQFAVAPDGTLAWVRSPLVEYPDTALVRVDRRGQITRLPAEARPYGLTVRVSPDGRRLAVTVITSTAGGLWVYDLESRMLTPIHRAGLTTFSTWWSANGRRLVRPYEVESTHRSKSIRQGVCL